MGWKIEFKKLDLSTWIVSVSKTPKSVPAETPGNKTDGVNLVV